MAMSTIQTLLTPAPNGLTEVSDRDGFVLGTLTPEGVRYLDGLSRRLDAVRHIADAEETLDRVREAVSHFETMSVICESLVDTCDSPEAKGAHVGASLVWRRAADRVLKALDGLV